MADSRKPVQPAVAPEVPAPVAAPTHEWELALLRAHEELTLRWQPLIGLALTEVMRVLLAHTDSKRTATLSQLEIARLCGICERHARRLLAELETPWNLIQRQKRQGVSCYVISAFLLPDFGADGRVAYRTMGASPLFGGSVPMQNSVFGPDTHSRSEAVA